MKILAIRGKNLASLEGEFEIDFTSEPLQSAGIFAITGQTGAGKSTILDALCLALFDDTPRLNKAELVKKEDLDALGDKISPQDCRNILRRGASDGYAEVDFVALNGDKYRSRWCVKRARGKSDGALQPTTMALENLSNGIQEQGTKRDFLNRITEIIGLTFYQFTRAVLLAQGDFANFLKARQSEKAELLEKLTGTAIYSSISIQIYQKAVEAKGSLDLIQQRIKDVRLLSDEELDTFIKEKQDLEKEVEPLKHQQTAIEKKLDWLREEELLKNEMQQAANELKNVQEQIIQAASRYEYISLVDLSQEIRDVYIELNNKQTQSEKLTIGLQVKEKEISAIIERVDKIATELKIAKNAVDETDQKYNTYKPEIARAKELDFKIQAITEERNKSAKELEVIRDQLKKVEHGIAVLQKQETVLKEQQSTLSEWFTSYEPYKAIVPRIDYVTSLINNAYGLKKQRHTALQSLESAKAILITYRSQLEQYQQEAERLNHLLPTEILDLRKKLEEGKPCPVCGSVHHPLQEQTGQQDRIDESKLESEKKKVAGIITQTTESIEKTNKSITEFEVHVHNFQNQYDSTYNELRLILEPVSQWEADFNGGCLLENLTKVTGQWNKNKQMAEQCHQQIENLAVRLEAGNKSLEDIREQFREKEKQGKTIEERLSESNIQRKQLLNNKRVEDVEEYFTKLKEQYTHRYEQLRTEKEKAEKEKSTLEGIVNQLKKDKALNNEDVIRLQTDVQGWLANKHHQISSDMLKELVSKSHEWIQQEKYYLNNLKNQELIHKTTFAERSSKSAKHQESGHKPGDEETKDILLQQFEILSEKKTGIDERLNGINASVLAHQRGKEQVKAFEKELHEKTELYNNWAKLNDLLGSASGNKFKTIAQGYTLDVLLSYANKHLEELTPRYTLEKIPGTLALQVIDNDMLGEVRTVHSLSGGESFLISLALALGLSSLSSNRMKIESLFIDEGFGALDVDTLSIAMDALDNLHTRGRKIGVISHVEEMKERITTQIQVVKSANGRSAIRILGV